MSARNCATKLGRLASQSFMPRVAASTSVPRLSFRPFTVRPTTHAPGVSSFSTTARNGDSLPADVLKHAKPADLKDEEYHALADDYMETILQHYEAMQDEREDIDVEYSAGVLNLTLFDQNQQGKKTWVINKQPPNKQIWLSSPITGPKRYDWVVISEGQDQKEGTGSSTWVYLRDGSTLREILVKETGIDPDALP